MARLDSPWRESLSKADFDQYPVWVWDDENVGHLPLSEFSYEYGTLFIKAQFETGGYTFEGFLVGIDTFYAFGIFIDEETFILNLNLTSLIDGDVENIFQFLKCQPFNFFPIYYKSDVSLAGYQEVSGILSLHSDCKACKV